MKIESCVAGLLINGEEVALIRKTHPNWQKGRLNGIGGHIEKGETPRQAMIREFHEETGAYVVTWREFCFCEGTGYEVYWFVSKEPGVHIQTTTDEQVNWYSIYDLTSLNVLPILQWLIPMANYKYPITAKVIHESPEC
jgi:8-oxo-dGTP diphosphatase